ncbi:tRNA preQ1(34) S-adenosylmethionine ribosyltransferase-isomerase QueA [candidate division WOR-3 bacterium]|nr:tRNA preQ1(34) S-adenosylmethionine ribosyltransferase-isomerase QueA [candidate division WOR-3 bacterium]
MRKDEFVYELPPERIALYPKEPRDGCLLIVLHRDTGKIEHRKFSDIVDYLIPGDCLVLNESRVQPVRFRLRRASSGVIELLFTGKVSDRTWVALARPAKRIRIGERLFDEREEAVVEIKAKNKGRIELILLEDEKMLFARLGLAPLPAYIHRVPENKDLETYQTVFAREGFSIAAPTAGLHFTKGLLDRLQNKGVEVACIQLDVGEGTFRPIKTDDVEDHDMAEENYTITLDAADKINNAQRVIAVGTTVTRTLESFSEPGLIPAGSASTDLFIYPGHKFKRIHALLTNFHQPASTPLLLTTAFGGKELVFKAYTQALERNYRFLSYGDAMLIF